MTQELSTIFDKSFQGKWRGRLPKETKMKFAVEQEYANQIIAKEAKFNNCTPESIQQAMMSASSLISPRIDNEVKKIVNTSPIWGRKSCSWRR